MIPAGQRLFALYGSSAIGASLTTGTIRISLLIFGVAVLALTLMSTYLSSDAVPVPLRITPLWYLFLAYLMIALQDVIQGSGLRSDLTRSLPGGIAIGLAALLAARSRAIKVETFVLLLKFNVLASLAVGLGTGTAFVPCREDKCSAFNTLLRGGFVHENYMGYSASLLLISSIAAALLARNKRSILDVSLWPGLGMVCLYWSGSRVSLGFTAVTFGLLVTFALARRHRLVVAIMPPALFGATSLYLIESAASTDFTNRGRRWIAIRESLGGVFTSTGNGFSAWDELVASVVGNTTPHSAYGAVLLHGGLLALAPYVVYLVGLCWRSHDMGSATLYAIAVYIAARSVFETVWNPAALNEQLWILLLVGLAVMGHIEVGERAQVVRPSPTKGRKSVIAA